MTGGKPAITRIGTLVVNCSEREPGALPTQLGRVGGLTVGMRDGRP